MLAATLRSYLDQITLTLRPRTVTRTEATLREFACFLAGSAPEVSCMADVRRGHIEAFKRTWRRPAVRPGSERRGGAQPPSDRRSSQRPEHGVHPPGRVGRR